MVNSEAQKCLYRKSATTVVLLVILSAQIKSNIFPSSVAEIRVYFNYVMLKTCHAVSRSLILVFNLEYN